MMIKEWPEETEKVPSMRAEIRAVMIPKIIIHQRNTGESFGLGPEWGFESIYPDLKGLRNPRVHLDYYNTIETQPIFWGGG